MAAENKTLSKLRHEAVDSHGDTFADVLYVDFTGAAHSQSGSADSSFNLTADDWFKAFNLPQGALITECGWVVKTEQGTVTFAMDAISTGITSFALKSAAVMGAAPTSVQAKQTVAKYITDTDGNAYLKITGAAATCTTAKVWFYVKGILLKGKGF